MPSMGRYHRNIFNEKKRYQSALMQRSDLDHPTYIIDADFRDWSDIVLRKQQRAMEDMTRVLNSQGADAGVLATVRDSWQLKLPPNNKPENNFTLSGFRDSGTPTKNSPEHCARAYIGGFAATLFEDTDYKCEIQGDFNPDLAAGIHRRYTRVSGGKLFDDRAKWTSGFYQQAAAAERGYRVRYKNNFYNITDNTETSLTLAGDPAPPDDENPLGSSDAYYYIELRAAGAAAETVQVYLDCHLEDHGMAEDADLDHNPGGTPLEAMRRTRLIQQVVLMSPPAGEAETPSPIVDYTDLGGVRHYVRKIGELTLAAAGNSPANAAAITNSVQPLGQDLRNHIADFTNPHGTTLYQNVLFANAIYGDVPVEGEATGQLNVIASLLNLTGNLTTSGNLAVDGYGDSHIGLSSPRAVASATTDLSINFDKTTFNKLSLTDGTSRGGDVEIQGGLEIGPSAANASEGAAALIIGKSSGQGNKFTVTETGKTTISGGLEPRLTIAGKTYAEHFQVGKTQPPSIDVLPGNDNGPCPVEFSTPMVGVQTWVDASDFNTNITDTSLFPISYTVDAGDDILPPLTFGVASLDRYNPKMGPEGISWGRTNPTGETTTFGGENFNLGANSWGPTLTYNLCSAYQGSKYGDTGSITFNQAGQIVSGSGYRFPDKAPVLTRIDFMFGVKYPKANPGLWAGIPNTELVQIHLHGRNVDNRGQESVYSLGAGRTPWGAATPSVGHPAHSANFFNYTNLITNGLRTSNICTESADFAGNVGQVGVTYNLASTNNTNVTVRVVTALVSDTHCHQNVFVSMDLSALPTTVRSLRMRTPLKLVIECATFPETNDLKITFAGCVLHASCHALGGF